MSVYIIDVDTDRIASGERHNGRVIVAVARSTMGADENLRRVSKSNTSPLMRSC